MDTFAMLNGTDAREPKTKRPRLTVDERNARTSARQVARFLSGRISSEFAYLKLGPRLSRLEGTTWTRGRDVASRGDGSMSSYADPIVTTWTGEKLLRIDSIRDVHNAGAFGGWKSSRLVYFSGVDARGRRWHGRGPGDGMFCRLHLNRGAKARPGPVTKEALSRAILALYRAIEQPGNGGPLSVSEARRVVAHVFARKGSRVRSPLSRIMRERNSLRARLHVSDYNREAAERLLRETRAALASLNLTSATFDNYETAQRFVTAALNSGAPSSSLTSPDGGASFVVTFSDGWRK